MKQYRGKRNRSLYYEGVIETAILKTCRQINREARHLPLMLNTLNFLNPSDAHHFLGFKILPSQRTLLRALHVNVRGTEDFNGIFSNHLIPQLAELSLNHIGITMQGRIELEWFTEWKWLETCLAQFKGLTSIDLVIGSGIISSAAKRRIAEELKKKILAAPTAPSNPLKRKASQTIPTDETGILTQAGNTPVGLSWSDTISVKTSGREIKANQTPTPKDERSRDVMIVCDLTSKYERLERYARSYDPEVSSVKIRLGKTLEAATEGDEEEFERLAEDVIGTLEAHLANIIASRGLMPWRLSPIRQ
ncbi:hypothetical protein MMC16_007414 [Acarospora aff. strigata]|nr:hypothetical protein [Acarospora aff. strigata]